MKNLFTLYAVAVLLTAMQAGAAYLPGGGISQSNPALPPDHGGYVSPSNVHACFATGGGPACLQQGNHQGFALTDTHQVNGGADQLETFNSHFTGLMFFNGNNFGPVDLIGPVQIVLHGRPNNSSTGEWNTEMLSMDLSGNTGLGPIKIRESPTLASLGSTKITDTGGGAFHIDSFFDVFTELSLDNGGSWTPSTSSTHVDLVNTPEPASLLLAGAALIGLASIRRRKLQ